MADQERDEFDPLAEEQLAALGGVQGEAESSYIGDGERFTEEFVAARAAEADPDEEPPEPEGHKLSKEVADWLGSKEYFHGPLPHDIGAIWGAPPFKVSDEATARILIGAWGLEAFRGSTLHQAALQDAARKANTHEARTRFKSEREKTKKR